jgi:hypothetical protein
MTQRHKTGKSNDNDIDNAIESDKAIERFQGELQRSGGEAQAQIEVELAEADKRERRGHATRPARPRGRTTPIAVRFDEFTIKRLKQLAERRNTGYQTLLKEFVVERLYEEEKREGIV